MFHRVNYKPKLSYGKLFTAAVIMVSILNSSNLG